MKGLNRQGKRGRIQRDPLIMPQRRLSRSASTLWTLTRHPGRGSHTAFLIGTGATLVGMLGILTHDLRDAARLCAAIAAAARSAVLILAIGIASSTGLFAVVDAVILHPLPYAGADRIARIQLLQPSRQARPASVTAEEFPRCARHRRSTTPTSDNFTDARRQHLPQWWDDAHGQRSLVAQRRTPLIGRVFTEADAPVGSEPTRVAVLSYRFWQIAASRTR